MGTHNRLMGLGDAYLEAIAIDPEGGTPPHARWFDLDRRSGPPRLSNWVLRLDDLEAAVAAVPQAGRILSFARERPAGLPRRVLQDWRRQADGRTRRHDPSDGRGRGRAGRRRPGRGADPGGAGEWPHLRARRHLRDQPGRRRNARVHAGGDGGCFGQGRAGLLPIRPPGRARPGPGVRSAGGGRRPGTRPHLRTRRAGVACRSVRPGGRGGPTAAATGADRPGRAARRGRRGRGGRDGDGAAHRSGRGGRAQSGDLCAGGRRGGTVLDRRADRGGHGRAGCGAGPGGRSRASHRRDRHGAGRHPRRARRSSSPSTTWTSTMSGRWTVGGRPRP